MEPLGYKVRQKSTNATFSVDGIHFHIPHGVECSQ